MKKILFPVLILFAIFFSLSFVSAIQVETNQTYSQGENFIAKISGIYDSTFKQSDLQVSFSRGTAASEFPYSLTQIDEGSYPVYYVSLTIPSDKPAGEYSIKAAYTLSGSSTEQNATSNFTILNKKTFADISPPFSVLSDYEGNFTIKNTLTKTINVEYGFEGTSTKTITLYPQTPVNVTVKTFGGNNIDRILFTYGNDTYPAYVYSGLSTIPIENQTYVDNNSSNDTNSTNKSSNETKSFWEILFGSGDKKNSTSNNTTNPTNNETINQTVNQTKDNVTNSSDSGLQTCSELNLPVCSASETCDSGNYVNGLDASCCNGSCVAPTPTSSIWKTIGWVLLGVVALFLVWFFMTKFSRTRRSPAGLFRR